MIDKFRKYRSCIFERGLVRLFYAMVILSAVFLSGCDKTNIEDEMSYEDHSSQVGPEGGKILFFKNLSNIPDHLFPSLEVQPNTFPEVAQIKVYYQQLTPEILGNQYASYSDANYAWSFASSIPELNNPISLTIPFEEPFSELMLEDLKDHFKLYRANVNTWNWKPVENFTVDTLNNLISTEINDFGYRYAVLFEEIRRNDNFVLSVSGDVTELHQFANADYFVADSTDAGALGFHYSDGNSGFQASGKTLGVDYEISFSFSGHATGIFDGNEITVAYKNKKSNENWVHNFANTSQTTITILKYGDIGQSVVGGITGTLKDVNNTDEVTIDMNFKMIRTR